MGKTLSQSSKKRKFTFNIVDALIILALVALIALIVYTLVLGKSFEDLYSDKAEIAYTVSINDAELSTSKSISVGDKVYHSDKDKNAGVITNISQEPSKNGEGVNLKITISATARVDKNGVYSINDEIINKGSVLNVKFARYEPQNAVCEGLSSN